VALDGLGPRLGDAGFPATELGYARLAAWMHGFGDVDRVGVESSGSYGAGLTRALIADGMRVVEVNRPHGHTR